MIILKVRQREKCLEPTDPGETTMGGGEETRGIRMKDECGTKEKRKPGRVRFG